MSKKISVETKDVTKFFGSFQALKGITADIYEGEVVVVLGPSGSGKSTYIRTLNGLEEHDSGLIKVNGTELNNNVKNIICVGVDIESSIKSIKIALQKFFTYKFIYCYFFFHPV